MASKEHNVESDATLTAVEVHDAIVEERFRDACQQGDLDTVRSILSGYTEDGTKDMLHRSSSCTGTPMFEAIIWQRVKVVEYLLDIGYNIEMECEVNIFIPIFFRDKCTALCLACAVGDVPIVKLLLQKGASVNHSSVHSSPVIYASEYDNTELMSLLLEQGADINLVPQGLKTEAAVLPLYQACLMGYKDTAELLFNSSNVVMDQDKKICLLGLLGAQCINKNSDYEGGLKYWKKALMELEQMRQNDSKSEHDLMKRLQQLYIRGSAEGGKVLQPRNETNSLYSTSMNLMFKDMKLCTTVEELETMKSDEKALYFQALLVLESILGPSHPETTQQVSQAARMALESGDLGTACKLFLYIIDSNATRGQTATATEYTSQFADLLLNVFSNQPEDLKTIDNIVDILLIGLSLVEQIVCKLLEPDVEKASTSAPNPVPETPYSYFDSQTRNQSKLRLLVELLETFMGFLCMVVDQDITVELERKLFTIVQQFIQLKDMKAPTKWNIESELFKIAVYGGQCTSSTLYFFQEDFFPNTKVLSVLVTCGANVNCQDYRGDSPLHFATDCPQPDQASIKFLLEHNAHIDICNRHDCTPLVILQKMPNLRINPFHYVTLKCLAAAVIVKSKLTFVGQVPRSLEAFIPMHGKPVTKLSATSKKPSTLEENPAVNMTR